MNRRLTTTLAALAFALPAHPSTNKEFEAHWRDGKAELDGYRLTIDRYGEPREGHAVAIFVTEPFSRSNLVKLDRPGKDPRDSVEVIKLNLVRDFQTGIYDYNTMTSVFSRADHFSPLKITFSSAEWCGHVYEELRFRPTAIEHEVQSYFQDESTEGLIDYQRMGGFEDNLFILLRGLRSAFLQPGEIARYPLLEGALGRRMGHHPPRWSGAQIERLAEPEEIEVAAGTFQTMVYAVATEDGRMGTFHIETAYPHRIIRWEWMHEDKLLERAELTGSLRAPYWQLNKNGNESYLEELGLR
jgi:hypothetical protein